MDHRRANDAKPTFKAISNYERCSAAYGLWRSQPPNRRAGYDAAEPCDQSSLSSLIDCVSLQVSTLSYEEQFSLYMEANELFNADRYAEAEPIFAAFAREIPCFEHGMVWYQLADIFERKGQIEKAGRAYLSALECEWSDIYATGYAFFLWRTGRDSELLTLLRDFRHRVSEGQAFSPPGPPIDSVIVAIESGTPYEVFCEEHWPPS